MGEVSRVLGENGRVALAVWQSLERHPFYEQLHRVIEARLGVSSLEQIFALGDEADLRALIASASFRNVELESIAMTARFPNPEARSTSTPPRSPRCSTSTDPRVRK